MSFLFDILGYWKVNLLHFYGPNYVETNKTQLLSKPCIPKFGDFNLF